MKVDTTYVGDRGKLRGLALVTLLSLGLVGCSQGTTPSSLAGGETGQETSTSATHSGREQDDNDALRSAGPQTSKIASEDSEDPATSSSGERPAGPTAEGEADQPASDTEAKGADLTPAEEVTGTLCNLTSAHLLKLQDAFYRADNVDMQNLQLATLSLSDSVSIWEGLRTHFPESEEDFDRATRVLQLWEEALVDLESGEPGMARTKVLDANAIIDQLPDETAEEWGC